MSICKRTSYLIKKKKQKKENLLEQKIRSATVVTLLIIKSIKMENCHLLPTTKATVKEKQQQQ